MRAALGPLRQGGVAQRHAQAGQELLDAKGLRQVVVGPAVERRHLVLLAVADRQDDDRRLGPLAQAGAHLNTVHLRQAQVQDDDVGRVGGRQRQALLTGAGRRHAEALLAQDRAQGAQDLRLVVDDQDVRLGGHSGSASCGDGGGDWPSRVSGSVKRKANPSGRFSPQIRPPCASTIPRHIDNPSPVPVTRSACVTR